MKHCVYKHLNNCGDVIYVGMSASPDARYYAHKNSSYWFNQISKVEEKWYETKEKAEMIEAFLIFKIKPKFNKRSRLDLIAKPMRVFHQTKMTGKFGPKLPKKWHVSSLMDGRSRVLAQAKAQEMGVSLAEFVRVAIQDALK